MKILSLVLSKRSGREVAELYRCEWGEPISYGTLYTTLRRLSNAGWVSVEEARDPDRRVRWYHITGRGVKAMNRGREHYRRIADFKPTTGASSRGLPIAGLPSQGAPHLPGAALIPGRTSTSKCDTRQMSPTLHWLPAASRGGATQGPRDMMAASFHDTLNRSTHPGYGQ